eukprot:179936-Amphidinium_carterae.1
MRVSFGFKLCGLEFSTSQTMCDFRDLLIHPLLRGDCHAPAPSVAQEKEKDEFSIWWLSTKMIYTCRSNLGTP